MTVSRIVVALLFIALAFVSPVQAQPSAPADAVRLGVLLFTPMSNAAQDEFRQGLRELGYVEGKNLVVEWRSAAGSTERANALAAELVRLNVAVIVAEFTPAVRAAKQATQTIPIVMAPGGDPVASGLVASLARPGGNVTGLTNLASELSAKRLEILREVIPGITHVGLLILGSDPLDRAFVAETRAAADSAGIQLHVRSVPRPGDLDPALAAMTKDRVAAVIVPGNLPVPPRQVAESAARYRLPSIAVVNPLAEAGALMSYGASIRDIRRRAAIYVDKILKGARPPDLPVEQPTRFELVINLKTARALGVVIPPSVLLRADQVIE